MHSRFCLVRSGEVSETSGFVLLVYDNIDRRSHEHGNEHGHGHGHGHKEKRKKKLSMHPLRPFLVLLAT